MASDAEQLIRQARGGDAEALGRLLEPYRTYLTILARVQIGKQLRGKVDPADVVQETFLEVHRRIAHFRGDSPPRFLAWLRSILATRLALVASKPAQAGLEPRHSLPSGDRRTYP